MCYNLLKDDILELELQSYVSCKSIQSKLQKYAFEKKPDTFQMKTTFYNHLNSGLYNVKVIAGVKYLNLKSPMLKQDEKSKQTKRCRLSLEFVQQSTVL